MGSVGMSGGGWGVLGVGELFYNAHFKVILPSDDSLEMCQILMSLYFGM